MPLLPGVRDILPPRPFVFFIMGRATILWAVFRGFAMASSGEIDIAFQALIWLTAIVLLVTLLETRRQRETIFLMNMGIPSRAVWLAGLLPIIIGEVFVEVAVRIWMAI